MSKMEVGNFVTYKKLLMAVVAINEEKNKVYALCYENHKMATFDMDDKNATVVKSDGCPRLVKGIYDLMKQFQMFGE